MKFNIKDLELQNNEPIEKLIGKIRNELECRYDILNNKIRYILEDSVVFDSEDLWGNRVIIEVYFN